MAREYSVWRRGRRWSRIGAIVPALLCALLPLAAAARHSREARAQDPPVREGQPPVRQQPRESVSLDQAIAMAERRYKARVVRANTIESDGGRYHVLRLLSEEGRIWNVRIDAATGQER